MMDISYRVLQKLAGFALIGTAIFTALGFLTHPHESTGNNHSLWLVGHIFIMLGLFSNFIGIFGAYLANAKQLGIVGLTGFLVIAISLALYIGKVYWSGFIYPLIIADHPEFITSHGFGPGSEPQDTIIRAVYFLGAIAFALGHLLLGLMFLRVKCFPTPAILCFLIGAVLVGLWPLLPALVQHLSIVVSLIYAIGVSWIGAVLIRTS